MVWTATGFFSLGAQSTNWVAVFDETFADNPVQRFKILPVTESPGSEGTANYDEEPRWTINPLLLDRTTLARTFQQDRVPFFLRE